MVLDQKLKHATFKYIESEIGHHKTTGKEIIRLREEIMSDKKENDDNYGGGVNSVRDISRPTERIATRLVEHKTLRNLEEIHYAIEDTYIELSDRHKQLMDVRYWKNRKLDWNGVADEMKLHRNTVLKLRKEVVYNIADKIGVR